MLSQQRYAAEAEMDLTARQIAKTTEEAQLAGRAWTMHRIAAVHAGLALRWQKTAADDRQLAAQRASQGGELRPQMALRNAPAGWTGAFWSPPRVSAEELERQADEAAAIAERHVARAEKCGAEGTELAAQAAKLHQENEPATGQDLNRRRRAEGAAPAAQVTPGV